MRGSAHAQEVLSALSQPRTEKYLRSAQERDIRIHELHGAERPGRLFVQRPYSRHFESRSEVAQKVNDIAPEVGLKARAGGRRKA